SLKLSQLLHYEPRWTTASYFSVLTWLVLGVGAGFEFPLLLLLLVRIGILQVATLRKYRRHAIVAIFIIAAMITPTPDPINMTLFAIPLYILFEISILIAARVERKRR